MTMMKISGIIALLYVAVLANVVSVESVDRTGVRGAATAANDERQLQTKSIGFKLINAVTGKLENNLAYGDVVNIGSNPPGKMTIEVVLKGYSAASVKITLTGAANIQRVESGTLSLCGNNGSKRFPCPDIKLGKYKVKAELYTGLGATGTLFASADVDFDLTGKMLVLPIATPKAVTTKPPTKAPVILVLPIATPKAVTTKPPVKAPVMAPVDPASCSVPKLVGSWENWPTYPLNVAESIGGMVGDDFMVFSGFNGAWSSVTKVVYAYNVRDANATWDKMDDVPVPGFTHAATAINGKIVYMCGAYVVGKPGPDSNICLMYNHTASPGSKWTFLPQLPDGRGGGGMNHIKESNSLLFTIGSTRRGQTIDFPTTWELYLDDLQAGWVKRADSLYTGNHVSHVTVYYKGKPRYYWAGGQKSSNEESGNQNDNVEWDQASETWIRRANMKKSRGHASSSTIAYGCGYLMIGGAVNVGKKTSDISWYNIDKDTWTRVGDLPDSINTPVCDIVRNLNGSDWIYCQTGSIHGKFSWKTKISL